MLVLFLVLLSLVTLARGFLTADYIAFAFSLNTLSTLFYSIGIHSQKLLIGNAIEVRRWQLGLFFFNLTIDFYYK